MSRLLWIVFGLLAIGVGLYPAMYVFIDMKSGLLSSKPEELLKGIWMIGFYLHIIPGGIALLAGWPQFSRKLRSTNMPLHLLLGKIYMSSVGISGVAGLCISFQVTGGIIAKIGFALLAVAWLFTSFVAWRKVRQGQIEDHRLWAIRSYALCFSAVTLRTWLPIFFVAGIPFLTGYMINAWLCWVPNLLFVEYLIFRRKRQPISA